MIQLFKRVVLVSLAGGFFALFVITSMQSISSSLFPEWMCNDTVCQNFNRLFGWAAISGVVIGGSLFLFVLSFLSIKFSTKRLAFACVSLIMVFTVMLGFYDVIAWRMLEQHAAFGFKMILYLSLLGTLALISVLKTVSLYRNQAK